MGEELTGGVEFEVLLEVGMSEVALRWLDTEKVRRKIGAYTSASTSTTTS
jgi:hypothetical protein